MRFLNYFFNTRSFVKAFVVVLVCIIFIRYFQNRLYLSDLKVYYGATRTFFGWSLNPALFGVKAASVFNHNPYQYPYGLDSGYYKYTPFFMMLFAPLALLPWSIISFLFPLLNLLFFYALVLLIEKLFLSRLFSNENFNTNLKSNIIRKKNLGFGIFLCLMLQSHNIYREILLGNINLFLMFFLVLFVHLNVIERSFSAGLILAILIIIKPHFSLIFAVLFLSKEFKTIAATLIFSFLFIIAPIFFMNLASVNALLWGWVHAMQAHNNAILYLNNSLNIQYIIYHFFGLSNINFVNNHIDLFVPSILVTFVLSTFFWMFCVLFPKFSTNTNLHIENKIVFIFLCAALIPFILLVDTNQLIYSIPLFVYIFYNFISLLLENFDNYKSYVFVFFYIFAILTQQIPGDWLPLHQFTGISYLILIGYVWLIASCYRYKKIAQR